MSSLIKVCDAVQCPFNSTDGCSLYPFSKMCHLTNGVAGSPRQRLFDPCELRQGFQLGASDHWLYADDTYDCAETEQLQAEFLADSALVRSASRTKLRLPYSKKNLDRKNPTMEQARQTLSAVGEHFEEALDLAYSR